jgi:3-methyl-2-oxobutanoate hydroxymethyltransferase
MTKLTPRDIVRLKGQRKVVGCAVADFFAAKAAETVGLDFVGTGVSLYSLHHKGTMISTAVTLEQELSLIGAVAAGAPNTFLTCPIPYGHAITEEETLRTCVALVQGGADAIKIQGAGPRIEKIRRAISEGLCVVGHVGLTPEFATTTTGFRGVGKTAQEAVRIYEDALKLQDAGVTWVELECVPYRVAAEITSRLQVPTIGIGSGAGCDGQVLALDDMLGTHDLHYPRHNKKYRNYCEDTIAVLGQFKEEVGTGAFPETKNSFTIPDDEFELFVERLE